MRANLTRAAEGFDRRSFTVAEILRIRDAGIISEDENFELIGVRSCRFDAAGASPTCIRGRTAKSGARLSKDEALTTAAFPGFSVRLGSV